jgi:glycosyltransferase involved in cell wall biosynthesis
MARRVIVEWGLPPERVVVIPGGSIGERKPIATDRNHFAFIYASHPSKGLDKAIEVLTSIRADFPMVTLDVYGGERLWGDDLTLKDQNYPDWIHSIGSVAQSDVEAGMSHYGAMLYLMTIVDSFTPVGSEAASAGVIVVASDHGAYSEIIRHGWNGFLITVRNGEPDLREAERLVRAYLSNQFDYEPMRLRAASSVQTWDEQAAQWTELSRE